MIVADRDRARWRSRRRPAAGAAWAAVAVAALWAVAPLPAQDEPAGAVTEEITVTEVLLDAVVTDKRGQVVLGLGAEDFVVRENGEDRAILDVTFYSSRRFLETADKAESLGIDPEAVPVERTFILFFHDQRRGSTRLGSRQLRAGRDAARWISEEIGRGDRVAVASFHTYLDLHQDLTHDGELLERAVVEAASGRRSGKHWPSRREEGDGPSLAAGLPAGKELARASRRIYSALELIADAAAALPGRKNLLLFSAGFGELGPGGTFQPETRHYLPMMRALNDANVAVYTLDTTPQDLRYPLAASLTRLASETNGRYFFNFVSFLTPLGQVTEETLGYYLISYRSGHPATDEPRYQRVRVGTRNPEFRVRARDGYLYGG